ncbi:MAG: cytochrome c biogenesis protein CcdA [Candidatus Omnitrophica bacterium]|nr:cytochrome c biogenesis protein CcdA [Candidatus Omnitrophota bacterium]
MELSGNLFDYFIVFGAGVVASFSPCIYPLMPITAGFIAGVNTSGTKLRGFVASLIYVLGLAITYSGFGMLAVLTGRLFGSFQTSPFVPLFVSFALLFFGLVMLDVVSIPVFGKNFKRKLKPRNLWAVFLFGMVSGLVVSPCTAPILGTILLYVSSKQNWIHSFSLLFVFSYGVGFSLILVGTFTGLLAKLPKSGKWLFRIKQISALILFLAAIYFFVKAIVLFGFFSAGTPPCCISS